MGTVQSKVTKWRSDAASRSSNGAWRPHGENRQDAKGAKDHLPSGGVSTIRRIPSRDDKACADDRVGQGIRLLVGLDPQAIPPFMASSWRLGALAVPLACSFGELQIDPLTGRS